MTTADSLTASDAKIKRRKSSHQNKNIFLAFHSNKTLLGYLKYDFEFIEQIASGLSGYGLSLSKITFCDSCVCQPFPKATCRTQCYRVNDNPEGFNVRSVFEYGMGVLEEYIEGPCNIPQNKGAKLALSRLLAFLSEDVENAQKAINVAEAKKDLSEAEWTVMLAHHLLSRLAVSPEYKIDKHKQGKQKDMSCTCGCGEKISGVYGDTSIGVPTGWHGCVDIVMDTIVTFPRDDHNSEGDKRKCFLEKVTSSGRILPSDRDQVRAQCIVFSYLQMKRHPECHTRLVPTIAISKKEVAVFFYDSENDILIETPSLKLVSKMGEIVRPTILILWLTLNYKFLCSSLPDEIKDIGFIADFRKHAGSAIEQYSTDVASPCKPKVESEDVELYSMKFIQRKNTENVNLINNDPEKFRMS